MRTRVLDESNDDAFLLQLRIPDLPRYQRFGAAYRAALRRIRADPLTLPRHHATTGAEVRYHRLPGFPYVVLFTTADPAEAVVFAVVHESAGPARLGETERRV